MGGFLQFERVGHVGWVTLNRPEKLNALGAPFWDGMEAFMQGVSADTQVRAVVLRGAGRAFTAGLDVQELMPRLPLDPTDAHNGAKKAGLHQMIRDWQRAVSSVERCRVPVIAAIHGPCIGGGVDLATACDIRLCSADAVFGVRETKLGLVADVGTLQRLPAIVGPGIARELAFTGRDFGAEAALEMRLVNRVLETPEALFDAAGALAEEIAAQAPLAVQGAKAVLNEQERYRIDRSLEYVATWNAAHLMTRDLVRGFTAMASGQRPEFEGD